MPAQLMDLAKGLIKALEAEDLMGLLSVWNAV
jgi:hypothetical protein